MGNELHRFSRVVMDRSSSRRGFTLIEILASMTILVFMVLMLTRVYTDGTTAWKTGSRNANRNMLARSVMDFMARELSMAAFEFGDGTATQFLSMAYFADTTPENFGLEGADEIFFVKLNKQPIMNPDPAADAGEKRSAQLIRYYVEHLGKIGALPALDNAPENPEFRFALWRDDRHPDSGSFGNTKLPYGLYFNDKGLYWMFSDTDSQNSLPTRPRRTGTILIDDVRTFEVFAYTSQNGRSAFSWSSFGDPDRLDYLDIYLETFDERDAEQAALLASSLGQDHARTVEFVERAVKRNYRRVYLYNKQGMQDKW